MVDFVVDKSLNVLLAQINEAAPNRRKDSDGSIGDDDHASRTSAHNPEDTADSSDGNDPDNQVDARDFTHDPANNADMGIVTEAIRLSKDRRVRLVIFNRRQFSNYWRDGIAPYTWRPYTGTNPHDKHAHVETNDEFNDDLAPWKIGIDSMNPNDEKALIHRVNAIIDMADTNPYGDGLQPEPNKLGAAIKAIDVQGKANAAALAALSEKVDTLSVSGIDLVALAELVRGVVREELDGTKLGPS